MSWINDLDSLASSGVIAFDAPAYILGKQPRYYGNPPLDIIPDQFVKTQPEPKKDEIESGINPKWKKTLFKGICLAGLALGAYKMRHVFAKIAKKLFHKKP